jgi:hypothetical protein
VVHVTYTCAGTSARNVYRDNCQLVVRPGAVFPDVCIGCGKPAWRNVRQQVFTKQSLLWFILPPGFDFIADVALRTDYHFDLPFCSICPADRPRLRELRLDRALAVFNGAARGLLDSLPPMPSDVAAEKSRTWLQRKFRFLHR